MIELAGDMAGMDAANEQLMQSIAAERQAPEPTSANEGSQRAGSTGQDEPGPTAPTGPETGKDATTDATTQQGAPEPGKPAADRETSGKPGSTTPAAGTEQAPEGKPLSKYEKDAARLPKSWKEFNAEKERIRSEQAKADQAIKDRQAELDRREAELAEQTREVSPEEYEAHAGRLLSQVRKLEAEAEQLEDAGKFEEAKAKLREARKAETWAEAAQKAAEEARKNPPSAKAQQRQQQLEAQRREWTLKAGVDFPDAVKAGTPVQARIAELLAREPKLRTEPSGYYWAARLATAEHEATQLPTLRTELDRARKRIAELELATGPGGPGASGLTTGRAADFASMSDAEKLAYIEQQARDLGTVR